jgi:hypothetical protein
MTRSRIHKLALLAACGVLASLALAPAARADDSQIRISEIYNDGIAGANPGGKNDFVELQFTAPGQSIPAGDFLRIFFPNGTAGPGFDFPPNNLLAENQRTVLIGWNTNAFVDFGIPTEFAPPAFQAGGAWCLFRADNSVIDCASWGNAGPAIGSAGPPGPALTSATSINRTEAPNCPTLLESADDRDNSALDFFSAAPTPRNNATLPSEALCPVPVTKKKCKKKKGKKRVAEVAKKKKCKKRKKR